MLLRRLVTFMTRLVLNALHLNPTLQRGSPITIQTIRPNIKTISNTKYKKLSKLRPNIKTTSKMRLVSFQETSFSSSQPVTRSLSSVGRKQPTSSSRLPVLGKFSIFQFCLNVCQFLVSFYLSILSNCIPCQLVHHFFQYLSQSCS